MLAYNDSSLMRFINYNRYEITDDYGDTYTRLQETRPSRLADEIENSYHFSKSCSVVCGTCGKDSGFDLERCYKHGRHYRWKIITHDGLLGSTFQGTQYEKYPRGTFLRGTFLRFGNGNRGLVYCSVCGNNMIITSAHVNSSIMFVVGYGLRYDKI